MRILHLPTLVGGGPPGLSRQLRELGEESQVWTVTQNVFGYPADRVLLADSDAGFGRLLKLLRAGGYVFGRWDVIHFNYGSTLFSTWYSDPAQLSGTRKASARVLNSVAAVLQRVELGVLRMRRIPVFVHYLGDDARQGDYSREHFEVTFADRVPPGYYTAAGDRRKRRQIALLSKCAAGVYAVNPDLMNVLPASAAFIPYGHIDVDGYEPAYPPLTRDRLVLVHAPSHRDVKGTDAILTALDELAAEGYDFRLDLVEGVSNAEALARYRDADVLIDQIYAGWYGGVAVEAMAMGKPVVAYIREADLHYLDPQMAVELPMLRAAPATIKEDLRRVLEMPRAELRERAEASRAFVERWHDPLAIATRIADDSRRARGAARRPSRAAEEQG